MSDRAAFILAIVLGVLLWNPISLFLVLGFIFSSYEMDPNDFDRMALRFLPYAVLSLFTLGLFVSKRVGLWILAISTIIALIAAAIIASPWVNL